MFRIYRLAAAFLFVFFLSSCFNIFEVIDDPEGDEQLQSRGDACFDNGDFECALENYQKLSGNLSDIKNSKLAFLDLAQNGIDMGTFIQAFGDGAGGKGFRKLANLLVGGATASRRTIIFNVFKKGDLINDRNLRGLVKTVSAITFAAHLLAEAHNADTKTEYTGDDIVQNSDSCKAATDIVAGCAAAACAVANNTTLVDGTVPTAATTAMNSATDISVSDLTLFHKALLAILASLNELGVGGKFDSGLGSFLDTITALGGVGGLAPCYRWLLISQGIAG